MQIVTQRIEDLPIHGTVAHGVFRVRNALSKLGNVVFYRPSSHHGRSVCLYRPDEGPITVDQIPYDAVSIKGVDAQKRIRDVIEIDEHFTPPVRFHGLLTLDILPREFNVAHVFKEQGWGGELPIGAKELTHLPYRDTVMPIDEYKARILAEFKSSLKEGKIHRPNRRYSTDEELIDAVNTYLAQTKFVGLIRLEDTFHRLGDLGTFQLEVQQLVVQVA